MQLACLLCPHITPSRQWWTGSAALMLPTCAWSAQLSAAGQPSPLAASHCDSRISQHTTAQTAQTMQLSTLPVQQHTATPYKVRPRDDDCLGTSLLRGCSVLPAVQFNTRQNSKASCKATTELRLHSTAQLCISCNAACACVKPWPAYQDPWSTLCLDSYYVCPTKQADDVCPT